MPYRGTRPWSRVRRPGLALSGSSARAKPLLVGGNGGRAGGAWPGVEAVAETVVFGEMSTGASNDLERATALARRMITEYGMGERLGVVTFGSNEERVMFGGESRSYSEQTAHAIDAEVHRLLDQAYTRAHDLIVNPRSVLDRLAQALLRWETLQGAELERTFSGDTAAIEPLPLPSGRLLSEGQV